MEKQLVRKHFIFTGRVQGVGFRYRAKYAAELLELTGWITNRDDGSVEMVVQGTPENIDALLPKIQTSHWIWIENVTVTEEPVKPDDRGFRVYGY